MTNELIVLGCGSSESMLNYNSSLLIKNDMGTLLVDCGHTIKHALDAQGLCIGDIDSIFITHVHGDHVFGLERVAYESLFHYRKRITLIFHRDIYEELWDQTLKGSLSKIGEGAATFSDYFDLKILDEMAFTQYGNHYELFRVSHTPDKPTFGLNINKSVFYSTDTTAIPTLFASLDFDIGFHDVNFADENPVHATLQSLLQHYPESVRKRLYLTSYGDNWPDYEASVNQSFRGLARQGMRMQF